MRDKGIESKGLARIYRANLDSLERFYPKLNSGAIVVADNMIHPGGEEARRYSRAVRTKPEMTSILLPVGTGLEISRFEPS